MSKEREDREELEQQQTDAEPDIQVEEKDGKFTPTGEPTESRAQRKARERAEETRRLIAEAQSPLMGTITALQQQIAGLAPSAQQQRPATQEHKESEIHPEWMNLSRRQEELVQIMANAKDQSTLDRSREEWHKLDFKKQRIAAEEATKNLHEQFKRENPPQTPFELRAIKQEFSDVLARPAARERARGYFLSAREEAVESRKPFNEIEAHRAALSRAAQEMGMRQPPVARPSDAQRGRLAGVSSTGVSAGGTGPMRQIHPSERRIAIALADKGTLEKEAISAWAKQMVKDDPGYFRRPFGE